MKRMNISYTNSKGQLVIPKTLRDSVGISDSVPLSIFSYGDMICIVPVKDVVYGTGEGSSYLDVLKKTRGSWGKSALNDAAKGDAAKRKLELKASKKRRALW